MEKIIQTLIRFQQKHPDVYIGGSMSLILQEAIPKRIPNDIDIISPKRTHIYDLFEVLDKPKHRMIRQYKFEGLKFELFNNPKAVFVPFNYKGHTLKLSPIYEVLEWKLRDKNSNNVKHANDIRHILS